MDADLLAREANALSLELLERLVPNLSYKPGWSFELTNRKRTSEHLAGSEGLTLVVRAEVPDSSGDGMTKVAHLFAPPPATWDRRTWRRWVFDCVMQVELHEAMEFYTDGERQPFFPAHGVGGNPYEIIERGVVR